MEMAEYDDIGQRSRNLNFFTFLVLLAQVTGLTSVILVAVWMGEYRGGFAWQENPGIEFNYHPLFMTLGFIFIYSDAILVYRVFRNEKKVYIKLLHAGMHMLALIFIAVALKATFDSHNLKHPPVANLYTLHSWIGLATVILFCCQWLFGFISFLFPKLSDRGRRAALPVHVFFGLAIFGMAVAAALTGTVEKTLFSILPTYAERGPEANIINLFGVSLVLHALLVFFIVTHPDYKRPQEDEDIGTRLIK